MSVPRRMHILPQDSWTFPVLSPASPRAAEIHGLFRTVLILCGGVFSLVAAWVAVAMWRFRNREDRTPRQDFGDERVEVVWVAGPLVIVTWIAVLTVQIVLTVNVIPSVGEGELGEAGAGPDLQVVAHQWWWEVHYPKDGVVDANEIHVPAGRRLLVDLSSADVIHSFWVPQLARKMDTIPGRVNRIWLEADEPGVYPGWCSEFCGMQHAGMTFRVVAHTPEDYARWVAARKVPAPAPESADAKAGERLFHDLTCADCHSVDSEDGRPNLGPDLTHLASRGRLASMLANTSEDLSRWLADPQSMKPGCRMPNFKLSAAQIRQLVAWLRSLR